MKNILLFSALFLAMLGGTRFVAAADLTLATRGSAANPTIVIPAKATPVERHAAEELANFLKQVTDVQLSIASDASALPARAILIGATRHTASVLQDPSFDGKKLGEDGFRLAVRGPHLVICGSTLRGPLYGVYTLLEDYVGCKWYASWCSVIPKREVVAVPDNLDLIQKPAFDMRRTSWLDLNRDPAFGMRMKLTPHGDVRYGGNTFRFGGGLGSCHTFNTLLPPSEFGKTHPEYYSMINGKRRTDHSQLCLTNPDVLRLVTERVLARIRKDPGAKFYGVSQNDWYNYCTCPNCAAVDTEEESHAVTNVRFVNAIAEAVEKEFPNVIIETLAYQYTRKPPKKTKLRHNVVPCLCSIECDFANSIPTSPYPQNVRFCSDIVGWSKQTSQLYLWDYTVNFHNYPMPFANVLTLQDNIKFFRANGVKDLFEQGDSQGRHADFAELKGWLLAKWMWNPDADRENLLKDFFNGYYGKAAPFVRAIFDETHTRQRQWSATADHPMKIFDNVFNPALPDDYLLKASALWDKAIAAVKDDPVRSYNVRMGAFSIDYTRFERMRLKPQDPLLWMVPGPVPPSRNAEMKRLQDSLYARMAEAKDIKLREWKEWNDRKLAEWQAEAKRLAQPPRVLKPTPQCGTIAAHDLRTGRAEYVTLVPDPLAKLRGDGAPAVAPQVLRFSNTHYEWSAFLDLARVHFQPGRKYRLSVRVRVDKQGEGIAFWSGIYSYAQKKDRLSIAPRTNQTPNTYTWYTLGTIEPKAGDQFWFGPGRFDKNHGAKSAVKAVFLDQLKIELAD